MENKHYGKVSHWFDEGQVGAIKPDENIGHSILLTAKHLLNGYLPQIGDEVSYVVNRDERNRECATKVEVLPNLREGARIKVVLSQWDFTLNGGYGLFRQQKPVFVLGPFLRDQSRVPDEGETLRGTLVRHDNGQWLLVDVETVAETSTPVVSKPQTMPSKPKPMKSEAPRLPQIKQPQPAVPPSVGLPLNQVLHGEVVLWEDDKGYGFIQCGRQSMFFHISAYHYRYQRPQLGEAVSFFLSTEAGEKQRAARVVRREDEHALNQTEALVGEKKVRNSQTVFGIGILLGVAYLAIVAWFFLPLALLYGAISLATLMLYGYDKTVARRHAGRSGYAGRVRESTLLAAGLLGGWPGAQAARLVFNHKTTKQPFVTYFWLMVAANVALTVWLLQKDVFAQILGLLPIVGS